MQFTDKKVSPVHSASSGRNIKPFSNFKIAQDSYNAQVVMLRKLGINLGNINKMMKAMDSARSDMTYSMDAIQPGVTTPSVITPVQFLQEWLPGFVDVITTVREIDNLIGIMTAGAWEDEQIVQAVRELLNKPALYGDKTNTPFASTNVNFVTRTVVRFEQGIQVTRLDEARAARIRLDLAGSERESAALGLEIIRNMVGFYGYNNGANLTYGFLNDPNLLAYNTIPATGTGSSTTWATKNLLQIIADLLQMISGLRAQSGGNINPKETKLTFATGLTVIDRLSTVSDLGYSVLNWLNTNYPNIRVVSAPELDAANSGANVAYLYADAVKDTSTDGGSVFTQVVPMKFMVLGVQQVVKGYEESFSNATAGVICKRPWGNYRITGC